MRRPGFLTFSISIICVFFGEAQALKADPAAGKPSVIKRIPLPGPVGEWDYASVDTERNRLYVGREAGAMSVDLDTGSATLMAESSGTAIVFRLPASDLLLSTNPDDKTAALWDLNSNKVVALLPTGKAPDAATYEPVSGLVVVANHAGGDLTLIDPQLRRAVGTISAVGPKLEFVVADGTGRVYVNAEATAEIVVVDIMHRKILDRYPLRKCKEPTGLGLDVLTHRLIAACGNGVAKILDVRSGQDLGTLPIGEGADAVLIDAQRRRAYIPNGDSGTLTVIDLAAPGAAVIGNVATQQGARTGALDPRTGWVYLPTAVESPDRKSYVAGSFEILVVGE